MLTINSCDLEVIAGSALRLKIDVYKKDPADKIGALYDPDSISVSIEIDGVSKDSGVPTRYAKGKYYFEFQTQVTWDLGDYDAVVTLVHAAFTSKDKFSQIFTLT